MRQKRKLTAVFFRQNINSRTSQIKFPARGESLHLCPVTPRTTFTSFPGLSLLSSAHALRQSERSSLAETTPPPRGEVWVSPETTERLFLQHSCAMTGPPLWAAAYPEKGKKKKKECFFKDARPYHKRKKYEIIDYLIDFTKRMKNNEIKSLTDQPAVRNNMWRAHRAPERAARTRPTAVLDHHLVDNNGNYSLLVILQEVKQTVTLPSL